MLESLTPAQFSEWQAAYALNPWGDDWQQAGTIAATIHNELLRVLASFAGGKIEEKDTHQPSDYVPAIKPPEEKKKRMSLQESLTWLRMQTGV